MLLISQRPRILSLVLPTSLGHTYASSHLSISNHSLLLALYIGPQLCLIAIYAYGYRTTGMMPILPVGLQRCLCEPVGAFLHAPSGVGDSPYTGEMRTRAAGRVLT